MKEKEEILSIDALFDIRLETLAAALLEKNQEEQTTVELEQIAVFPKGTARRRSNFEVEKIRWKHYEYEKALLIEINRKGLFDTLPDGLFLQLDKEYENVVEKTRAIEQQIKEARKFFFPFEQALYLPGIEAEQLEQKWTENFPDFIKKLWKLDDFQDCLNKRQQFLLCYLIPEAHRIVGNWRLTGLCFEEVLQKPVNLNFTAPLMFDIPNNETPTSECQLGEGAILGSEFRDDTPALEVCVKGITKEDLPHYLLHGRQRKLLEELLYSYFLPLEIPVLTSIQVTDDTYDFTLGEDYLGYNLKLKQAEN